MAKKRTMAEVDRDYKVCKKYVDEHYDVMTIKEIAEAIGLTEKQVTLSLERHPRVKRAILKQIADNQAKHKAELEAKKAEEKAKRKAEQEAKKAEEKAKRKAEQEAKKAEEKAKRKAEQEAKKAEEEAKCKAKPDAKKLEKKTESEAEKTDEPISFVIDASITGSDGLSNLLDKIDTTDHKIIMTSVTIHELEQMQRYKDKDGMDARRILTRAAINKEKYLCKLIDEDLPIADDCIIKYCTDNKDRVMLITSDKTMALKARMYGVDTKFIKQSKNASETTGNVEVARRGHSLYIARKVGDKLLLECVNNRFRKYMVISGERKYNAGIVELKKGDDVYVSTHKNEFYTFAHYRMTSSERIENNCNLVFSRRIYDVEDVDSMPEEYKLFMKEFIKK